MKATAFWNLFVCYGFCHQHSSSNCYLSFQYAIITLHGQFLRHCLTIFWSFTCQQMRPSLPDDMPKELVFIIQSCWVEDPNVRPTFGQIIRMLNAFLFMLPTPPSPEPNAVVPVPSNGIVTESSARARRKFSFIRQIFPTRRTRNTP